MKKPQLALGLFHLCGETTAEDPRGSTEASKAGVGTSEHSDDDRCAGPARRGEAQSAE